MDVKQAARRLIKSRLRRHIMLALAKAKPDQAWLSSAEVEEGTAEEAWAEWVKARAAHVDLRRVLHEALTEASDGVRDMFEGVADDQWLDGHIRSFVEAYDVESFLKVEG